MRIKLESKSQVLRKRVTCMKPIIKLLQIRFKLDQ